MSCFAADLFPITDGTPERYCTSQFSGWSVCIKATGEWCVCAPIWVIVKEQDSDAL